MAAAIVCNLQLGAGTAIPGIVAAMCGAEVTLSDREGSPRLQDNLRRTCELNHIPMATGEEGGGVAMGADSSRGYGLTSKFGVVSKIMGLTWGIFSPSLLETPTQDIVLASDCFYDSKGI